ncbi:MAG: hypothetical protein EHM35_01460 [Planctomycetaceae bacterium]|nr:MAG: hypothetical protein EHM35_01460 [Planctomycetaceae bacterium]
MLVLNEKTGRWNKQRKRADRFAISSVTVFSDIKEFVSHAGNAGKPELITSRSQLRAHERSNGMRQCGDIKPGDIIARQSKRRERDMQEASRLTRETNLKPGGKHFQWQ